MAILRLTAICKTKRKKDYLFFFGLIRMADTLKKRADKLSARLKDLKELVDKHHADLKESNRSLLDFIEDDIKDTAPDTLKDTTPDTLKARAADIKQRADKHRADLKVSNPTLWDLIETARARGPTSPPGPSNNNFILQGEGLGLIWIKPVHMFILENAFNDKKIIYDTNKSHGKPDLVIRSTHEWYKNSMNDLKNPPPDPQDPFFEYSCPYLCWSGEPLRCKIKPDRLPIYELNTYVKNAETSLDVGPYNDKIIKDTIWWGPQRYKYNNKIPIAWIPYILLIPADLTDPTVRKKTVELDDKPYEFVYIASNCSQQIREKLFQKLKAYDDTDTDLDRKVRAYGKCQKTEKSPHPKNPTDWRDNYQIYNDFKFVFAIENSLNPGYITEKIYLAFQGNAVPIYYGPPEIKNFFNEKAFYYMNDKMKDPQKPTDAELDAIAKELEDLSNDSDPTTGWKKYLSEPVYKDNKVPELFIVTKDTKWIKDLAADIRKEYDKDIKAHPLSGGTRKFKSKVRKDKIEAIRSK